MKQRISYFLVSLLIAFSFSSQAQIPTSGWVTLDNFDDGDFTNGTTWTSFGNRSWEVSSSYLRQFVSGSGDAAGIWSISTPFTKSTTAWQFDFRLDGGFDGQRIDYYFFLTSANSDPANPRAEGYRVRYELFNTSYSISLQRVTFNGASRVATTIASTLKNTVSYPSPTVTVVRKNNSWELYLGNTLEGTGNDATFNISQCAYQGALINITGSVPYRHGFDNIRHLEIPFGSFASALYLGTCRQPSGSFFNTTGQGRDLIDQNNKTFTDTFFGTYIQNSKALVLKGAEVKTFKGNNSNVCIPNMYYRITRQGDATGPFRSMDLFNIKGENCSGNTFPITGGPCNPGDQKWQRNDSSIDLTNLPPGNYTIEVYYEITGSTTSPTTGCGETIILNNNGNNYKATYTILSTPALSSTNPNTCTGSNGTITIEGSAPNTKYAVNYKDNGVNVGPDSLTSNASGNIIINGLNAGTYTEFTISNGCNINVNGPVTLIDPSLTLTPSSTPNTVCNGTSGGGNTPCTYTGPKVVINEIMVMPGNSFGAGGGDNTDASFQAMFNNNSRTTGSEWVELYNPSPCDTIDLGCYVLGSAQSTSSQGAFTFPKGTKIPPLKFLVVGGTNAPNVDINLNDYIGTPYLNGTTRWHLVNGTGWLAIYDPTLQIVDGLYWGPNADVINNSQEFTYDIFQLSPTNRNLPVGDACGHSGTIAKPNTMASSFSYIGNNSTSTVGSETIGKSTYRSTDGGGTWIVGGVGAANNTPGACNSTCATPSTGSGTTGTCNGTVSVVATGSGSFKYEWKNGNTGIGKDSAGVGNLCAGTYKVIVTDKTTGCVDSTTVTVTDEIPQVNPAFTQVDPICSGGSFTLPTTSTNNITGTWGPAIDNTKTTTYTFTPTAGQCANSATMTVTVNQPVTPEFTQVLPICAGGTITLPTSSNNSINGSWSPAIDNTQTTTYTFTPTDGQCATTATMTITVNEKKQPLISCGISTTNSVEFKWDAVDGANSYDLSYEILNSSSSPINSTGNTAIVFTVSGLNTGAEVKITVTPVGTGSCFEPASFTCKALACTTPNVTTTPNTVCKGTGGTPGGCTPQGTGVVINEVRPWPAAPFAQGLIGVGGEYIELYNPTCSPIDISCFVIGARSSSETNTGGSIILPQGTIIQPKAHFVIGTSSSSSDPTSVDFKTDQNTTFYCATGNFVLANSDGWVGLYDNNGTPVDAIFWTTFENQSNKVSTDDDFNDNPCTPNSVTDCITTGITLSSPAQIFATSPATIFYVGQTLGSPTSLPTSPTGKTFSRVPDGGPWERNIDPSIDGNNCNGGTCSTPSTPVQSTCDGTATVSITGNVSDYDFEWKDSSGNVVGGNTQIIDKLCAGKYTVKVTDKLTGCVGDTTVIIIDNIPQVTPTFSPNLFDTICQGAILTTVTLPGVSNNGITGTWNPGSLSSDVAGDISYTFTPDAGQCADPVTLTQRVNARVTPTFDFNLTSTICSGDPTTPNNLPGISNNNIIGSWSPTPISSNQSDVYIFTPLGNACANTATLTVTVIQRPSVTVRPDTTIYHNAVYPGDIFSGLPTGSVVTWSNSNPGIGLPASGTGNIPAFTAVNIGSEPVTATITVNATNNNCDGTQRTFKITVKPLNRDVFVPNVFTPNGDGKNDLLLAYGNYITKIEMRIFNQWGQLIKVINSPNASWDGTHSGKPQPVGVYVYTLRATLADGTEINKKGSITLLR